MPEFDDSRLDDAAVLARHDASLRSLALTGAHLRVEAVAAAEARCDADLHPRGIVLAGHESRLIRTVIEPTCPVPLVAWPHPGLPGWVGPLDLVVVQATSVPADGLATTVAEACRRGCAVILAAPAGTELAARSPSRDLTLVPTSTDDPVAAVVALLVLLAGLGLAPQLHAESVADAADMVAEDCSPHKDLSVNPAKVAAIALAESLPLVWGGSMLAARAARRIAEDLRRVAGRASLATPADDLMPLLTGAAPRDPFADPDEILRPVLVTLDDGDDDFTAGRSRTLLDIIADDHHLPVVRLRCDDPQAGAVGRYVSLLLQGLYVSAYLGVGLDRP